MLRGIDPVLSPDLLWALAAMGHGDDLLLADGNHPAEAIARASVTGKLIRLPGVPGARVLRAILSVLPVDTFTPDPLRAMAVVDDPDAVAPALADLAAEARASGFAGEIARLERFAFYQAARGAFCVVQTGETRFYGNLLIRKGAEERGAP
jgi:L-fucose mutarotase